MIEAMMRQWDLNLPLPIALNRASQFFGLKPPKRRFSRGPRREPDKTSIDRLIDSGVQLMPASALPKVLSFEEYKAMKASEHGG